VRIFASVEEFAHAAGDDLGSGDWLEITQDRIDAFAETTLDDQWIHVDPGRAASGPFGRTVAHGYLSLSLLPFLLSSVYLVEGIAMGVNYGADRLRFPSPVPVGSRIRARAQLSSVKPAAIGQQFSLSIVVEIEGQDKPALVAQNIFILAD